MKFEDDAKKHLVKGDLFETVQSQIDPHNLEKLYNLLSNLYKNSIGSIVREYTSNAYDATVEAGSTDPIVVRMDESDGNYFIEFEDFGVGLSPDRLHKVYFNYLATTKDKTNNQIGGFGVGAKSFLSYNDSFEIRTRYDGMESKWLMSKQATGVPAGEKLAEAPTDKKNGTRIRGYIHNSADFSKFQEECKKQLAYLPNVYFEGCRVDNDYQLVTGKNFVWRTRDTPYNDVHICLGNIAYPISWSDLGMASIFIPIGLKFEIGELIPTPSREDVEYDQVSIAKIKAKIEAVRGELQERYDLSLDKGDDFEVFVDSYKSKVTVIKFGEFTLDLRDDSNVSSSYYDTYKSKPFLNYTAPTFAPFDKVGLNFRPSARFISTNLLTLEKVGYTNGSMRKNEGGKHGNSYIFKEADNYARIKTKVYRVTSNTEWIPVKNRYLAEKLQQNEFNYMVSPRIRGLEFWKAQLELDQIPKKDWRKLIKLAQKHLTSYIIKNSESYDKLVVPQQWIDDEKAERAAIRAAHKTTKLKGEISFSAYSEDSLYNGKTNRTTLHLDRVKNSKVIYGTREDDAQLKAIAKYIKRIGYLDSYGNTVGNNQNRIAVGYVAQANVKILSKLTQSYTISEFMKAEYKKLNRIYFVVANHDKIKAAYDLIGEKYRRIEDVASESIQKNYRFFRDIYQESCTAMAPYDWEPLMGELASLYKDNAEKTLEEFEVRVERILEYMSELTLLEYLDPNMPTFLKIDYLKSLKVSIAKKYYQKLDPLTENLLADVMRDVEAAQIRREQLSPADYHSKARRISDRIVSETKAFFTGMDDALVGMEDKKLRSKLINLKEQYT